MCPAGRAIKRCSAESSMLVSVMREIDIWRAANLLIKQHGTDAEIEAAKLADLMLGRGDGQGYLLWLRIKRAIVEWRAAPPDRAAH